MNTRVTRRAVEKAARDLMNSRAAVVGELGVAGAERGRLAEEVDAATALGRQLVAQAEAEAARLVTAAEERAEQGAQNFADAYAAATAAGWAPADLAALGFEPRPSRRRRRAAADVSTARGSDSVLSTSEDRTASSR
jgi:hypothetical protein